MDIKNYDKIINEINQIISKLDFKNMGHKNLIQYSQYYVNFLFQFLGMYLKDMGSFAIINKEMVYHPPTYEKFINKLYRAFNCQKSKGYLRYNYSINESTFCPFPKKQKCYAYVESYHGFISELAHMAHTLVCYSVDKPFEQIVSELFDGTMIINFCRIEDILNKPLNEIRRNFDVYNCLNEEIKSLIREISISTSINNSLKLKFKKTIKKYIEEVIKCLNKIGQTIPSSDQKPEWHYVFEEVLGYHMQAGYLLNKYQKKFGIKDYFFKNYWSTMLEAETQTFKHVRKMMKEKYNICL